MRSCIKLLHNLMYVVPNSNLWWKVIPHTYERITVYRKLLFKLGNYFIVISCTSTRAHSHSLYCICDAITTHFAEEEYDTKIARYCTQFFLFISCTHCTYVCVNISLCCHNVCVAFHTTYINFNKITVYFRGERHQFTYLFYNNYIYFTTTLESDNLRITRIRMPYKCFKANKSYRFPK